MNKRAEKYLLETVRQNYEDIAVDFDRSRTKRMRKMLLGIIKQLKVKTEDKILDLGCGNARLLANLPPGVSYLGLDNSAELIKINQGRSSSPQTTFVLGDILRLDDFKPGDFNFIFCLAVFHHLPGKKCRLVFLKQVADLMDYSTRLVLSVWKLRKGFKFLSTFISSFLKQLIQGRILDYGDLLFPGFNQKSLRYYHAFSRLELERIIRRSGLQISQSKEDEHNYYFVLKK